MKLLLCLPAAALLGLTACGSLAAASQSQADPPPPPPKFGSVMDALSLAVAEVTGGLNNEHHDLKDPDQDVGKCYNLRVNVDFDVQVNLYQNARGDVTRELRLLTSDLLTVRKDINDLKADALVLTNHGATPLAGEDTTISTEEGQIKKIVRKANGDIDTVNSELATAYNMANSAATPSCPGQGPHKPPAQLKPVT